jgi:hypothetical protein
MGELNAGYYGQRFDVRRKASFAPLLAKKAQVNSFLLGAHATHYFVRVEVIYPKLKPRFHRCSRGAARWLSKQRGACEDFRARHSWRRPCNSDSFWFISQAPFLSTPASLKRDEL